jgi:1-acyl-sn-glycerol-3-phosphate acyltransferase
MAFLNYCWRWIGTALGFAFFGIGSLLLGVFVLPLIMLCVRNPERRLHCVRIVIGAAMKTLVIFMHRVGVLSYEISGWEHVDPDDNYLIIANHPSLIDVVFLLSRFPTADCVIKQSIVNNPFMHQLVRAADYIPNTDPGSLLEESIRRLRLGRSLILFPEGTRTASARSPELMAGAAVIAVRSGARCLPVVIHIEPATLTKVDHWYQVPRRRVFFSMAIQPSITADSVLGGGLDERSAGRQFNAYLQDYFLSRVSKNYSRIRN